MKYLTLALLLSATPAMAQCAPKQCPQCDCPTFPLNGSISVLPIWAIPTLPVDKLPPIPRCDDSFFPVKIDGSWKCVREVREPR